MNSLAGIFGVFFLLFPVLIRLIFVFVCYRIAQNNGSPTWMCLLGLFGVVGIIIMVVLTRSDLGSYSNREDNNNSNQKNNYQNDNINTYSDNTYNNNTDNLGSSTYMYNGKEVKIEFVKCKSCGAKVDKSAKFCTYCGNDLH